MEVKEIITLIRKEKTLREDKLKYCKNNINSSYILAKNDFRCIHNIEDVIETYENIIEQLEELQDRITRYNH